jgi:hypothetical protein
MDEARTKPRPSWADAAECGKLDSYATPVAHSTNMTITEVRRSPRNLCSRSWYHDVEGRFWTSELNRSLICPSRHHLHVPSIHCLILNIPHPRCVSCVVPNILPRHIATILLHMQRNPRSRKEVSRYPAAVMHIICSHQNARDIPLSKALGSLLERLKPPRKKIEVEEVSLIAILPPNHSEKKNEPTSPSPSQKEEKKEKSLTSTPHLLTVTLSVSFGFLSTAIPKSSSFSIG